MKGLGVFLIFCFTLASATKVEYHPPTNVADEAFIVKQDELLRLFYYPTLDIPFQKVIGDHFDIESNIDKFDNADVVKHFMATYREGMLPKQRCFSIMYGPLMNETSALFELFYHAKDTKTFYQTALWARQFLNEEMFVYAYSAALLHRPDCKDFYIPPLYEIFPNYFFTSEVIEKAYKVQMQGTGKHLGPNVYEGEDKTVYIESNYSNWYQNINREQRLTYLTEDIGWNTYYYNFFLRFPYWMDGEKYGLKKERRGELFWFLHKQLFSRYYMERLSNEMGEIPEFSFEYPMEIGYDPYLKYPNGMQMPSRPNHFTATQYPFYLTQLQDHARRIRDSVARGYIVKSDGTHINLRTPESVQTLGNLIEANVDSPDPEYYGFVQFLVRVLVGNSPRPPSMHKITPSALELFQTTLRDPMLYQIGKRYHTILFERYESYLTPYSAEELGFPGVKIESVDVEKLITYFEKFDTDITNAVFVNQNNFTEEKFLIKARQQRLNHVPFTVTSNIVSEKEAKAVVRFYLGPKYNGQGDVMTMNDNRHNFFQLDEFVFDLKSGNNVIERSSKDFWYFEEDWTPFRKVIEEIKLARSQKKKFTIGGRPHFVGFPERLMLPRGQKGGMPFQFYVIVTPYQAPAVTDVEYQMIDQHFYGYPFDRPIIEANFHLNNMHFEDVMIFHKNMAENQN